MERKTYTKEEIEKKFAELPADIQSFVFSADMEAALQEVGTKNQLHVDQAGALETETVDTMTGLESSESFAERIMDSLEVDEKKAAAIVEDVNNLLFLKIRASMQKVAETLPPQESPAPAAMRETPTRTSPPQEEHILPPTSTSVSLPAVTTPVPVPLVPISTEAELMLTEKTVSMPSTPQQTVVPAPTTPPAEAQKPVSYRVDPYRELPE